MAASILVVGLGEDSGKTTLASSLIAGLRARGVEASGFKPAGATSLWLHPEVLEWSAERGSLVTWDSALLARSSGGVDPVALNPVAALVLPPYRGGADALGAGLILGGRIVLLRVSECSSQRGFSSLHLLVGSSLVSVPGPIREAVERVSNRLEPRPFNVNPSFASEVLGRPAAEAADTCLSRALSRPRQVLVVESNSDVAAPTPGSLAAAGIVLVAGWGRIYVYGGDRWRKAVEVLQMAGLPWSVKTGEVVDLVSPERVFEPPFPPGEGGPAVEELVDAIVDSLSKEGL